MKFICQIWVLCCLLVSGPGYAKADSEELAPKLNPQKIYVSDPLIARKIAISFHHAILEANYEDGYLIVDLSEKEFSDLDSRGFQIEPATKWSFKFGEFQKSLAQKRAFNKANNISPKGIVGYECYPTVEETLSQAALLAQDNSGLAAWMDIGNSWDKANGQGGYDLMVLKMTNQAITVEKPVLFIQSSMHAREYTPAALTLDFAKHLLAEYSSNADIQWILDYHEIHILFQMNPDGRKIAENQILQRKNTNANHCPNGNVGVDLNRNFAFYWNTTPGGSSGDACDSTYRGPAAESEPETQAVSNYIRELFIDSRGPNDSDAAPDDTAGMHLDIHSYSELVLWPFGHTNSTSPNNASFVELGNKLAWFNKYTPMQSVGLYATDGTSDDVSYGELGIAALTFELGTDFFQACSVYEQSVKPDNIPALVYAAKVVAAPYLLPFGPEISEISLNGAENGISVEAGNVIDISVTASAVRTLRSGLGRSVGKIEYSIDDPIWLESTTPISLSGDDGNVSSGVETMTGQIDTSSLAEGRHTLFVRAFNGDNKPGVATAVFIDIGQNASPTPEFSISCTELSCSFDAAASSDVDGTIANYDWDFGDGVTAQGINASHTFASAGDKSITLTVTDNDGNQSVKTAEVSVTAPPVQPPSTPTTEQSSSGGGTLFWIFGLFGLLAIRKHSSLAR